MKSTSLNIRHGVAEMQGCSAWADRMALTRKGWKTEIRLSRDGLKQGPEDRVAIGVWADTSYWKGWITDICLHDHTIRACNDPALPAVIAGLLANVREACERAEDEFPDSVPCVMPEKSPSGRLIMAVNTHETRYATGRSRDYYPTEAVPDGPDTGPDTHLCALIAAAASGLHVTDSINPYFGRSRYARDCKDRDWGYRLRLAVREIDGVKVEFRPQEFSTRLLAAPVVAGLIHSSHGSLLNHFRSYRPDGASAGATGNGLPPGFRSVQEAAAEHRATEEAKLAASEADHAELRP